MGYIVSRNNYSGYVGHHHEVTRPDSFDSLLVDEWDDAFLFPSMRAALKCAQLYRRVSGWTSFHIQFISKAERDRVIEKKRVLRTSRLAWDGSVKSEVRR